MRKLRNIVIAGLVASGGLLLAQAPASAAEPSTPGAPTSVAPAPGGEQEVRAGCRYGGWFQFSDGRIVDIWICDEA